MPEGLRLPPLTRVIDLSVDHLWAMRRLRELDDFAHSTVPNLVERMTTSEEREGNSWLRNKQAMLAALLGDTSCDAAGHRNLGHLDHLNEQRGEFTDIWQIDALVAPMYCGGQIEAVRRFLRSTEIRDIEVDSENRRHTLSRWARALLLAVLIGDDGLALRAELRSLEQWRAHRVDEREDIVAMVEFNLLMAGAYLRKGQPDSAREWSVAASAALPQINGRIPGLEWHIEWMAARLHADETVRARALAQLDQRWRTRSLDPILARTITQLRGLEGPTGDDDPRPCPLYWP